MLYAADVVDGGLRDRTFIPLDCPECEEDLWWLSVEGIHRTPAGGEEARLQILGERETTSDDAADAVDADVVLHPKYELPASCFAYFGDPCDPRQGALPYRLASGAIDPKRLPKAIQAIISNYRGARVSRVPEAAIPDVLVRLGRAAAQSGKMPWQTASAGAVSCQLDLVLH